MIIIVAGRYSEFVEWCRERNLSKYSKDVVYATVTSLRGLQLSKDDKVIRIGTHFTNPVLNKINSMLYVLDKTRKP